METRAHHVVVGAFTVLVVAAALVFALWLGGDNHGRDFAYYDVVFGEAVIGLSQGSGVQYSGITVGDVARLTLDPADPRKVHALIRVGAKTPVRQDTRARLSMTGVTGTSIIQLSGGSPQSPPLTAAAGTVPVIVASPSPLSQLAANGEDLMTNLNDALRGARELLSDQNTGHINSSLASLDRALAALAGQGDDLHTLITTLTDSARQADAALQGARQLMTRADGMLARSDGLLAQQGPQILDNTQRLTESLARASDGLDKLIDANRASIGQGIAGVQELGPALQDLRSTLASIRQITRRLEENPSGYLLGRERSREFTP